MAEAGFLDEKRRSPASLGMVIALHGAALTALLLAKGEIPIPRPDPIDVYNVAVKQPPPPEPQALPDPPSPLPSGVDTVPAPIPLPHLSDNVVTVPLDRLAFPPDPTIGVGIDPVDVPKPPPPVQVEARMDRRSEPQPPYPASEQRLGREGNVTIRVLIGIDGRVAAAERVRATSDAFYRATEQHALRHWRFRPATVDGRPVESRKSITVEFRLDG